MQPRSAPFDAGQLTAENQLVSALNVRQVDTASGPVAGPDVSETSRHRAADAHGVSARSSRPLNECAWPRSSACVPAFQAPPHGPGADGRLHADHRGGGVRPGHRPRSRANADPARTPEGLPAAGLLPVPPGGALPCAGPRSIVLRLSPDTTLEVTPRGAGSRRDYSARCPARRTGAQTQSVTGSTRMLPQASRGIWFAA